MRFMRVFDSNWFKQVISISDLTSYYEGERMRGTFVSISVKLEAQKYKSRYETTQQIARDFEIERQLAAGS